MIIVDLTRYDGCTWTHRDLNLEFKDVAALNEYKKSAAESMDMVIIKDIKEVK